VSTSGAWELGPMVATIFVERMDCTGTYL
jgi:hypothetical protein